MSAVTKQSIQTVLLICLLLIPPWLRCFIDSKNYLESARYKFSLQDYTAAFNNYRLASTFDALGILSSKEAALEAFTLIANFPEEKQLPFLWELKSGLVPTSSLYWKIFSHPYEKLLISINQRIEELANPQNKPLLQELYPAKKNLFFQLLAFFTFISWIAGIFLWIWKSFNAKGESISKNYTYLAFTVLSYSAWLFCLYRA